MEKKTVDNVINGIPKPKALFKITIKKGFLVDILKKVRLIIGR